MFSSSSSSPEAYRRNAFANHPTRPSSVSLKKHTLIKELKLELRQKSSPQSNPKHTSITRPSAYPIHDCIPSWVFEYCGLSSPKKNVGEDEKFSKRKVEENKKPDNTHLPSESSRLVNNTQTDEFDLNILNENEFKSENEISEKGASSAGRKYHKNDNNLISDQMKEKIFSLMSLQFRPLKNKFPLEFFADKDQLLQTFERASNLQNCSSHELGFTKINVLNGSNNWSNKWIPCQVLGFDPKNLRFQIKYQVRERKDEGQDLVEESEPFLDSLHSILPQFEYKAKDYKQHADSSSFMHLKSAENRDIIKWVNRFNLYFVNESKSLFDQFHSFASQQKNNYEERAQLWYRVHEFNFDRTHPSYVALPEMPSFLFQHFLSLFLNTSKSINQSPLNLSLTSKSDSKVFRQAVERHTLEYAWHWRFAMKLFLLNPLTPLPPSMPPGYFSISSSPSLLSSSLDSILPSDALIRIPGFWNCLIIIRELLSDASNALVFPSSSCTLPFFFDQVMDMIDILDQQIRNSWFKQIRQTILKFCGYQSLTLHTRVKRLVDLIVYEKLDQLQLLYMKKLCAQLQRGVLPKSLEFPRLVDMSIEELLQPHPLHPYITPLLHLTWQLDSHRTKVFTDPSLDQSTRLIEELIAALHVKFINLPQFHDPQCKYSFRYYIAEGLSSKVCSKIPDIHAMKPDLMYFLWLFQPLPIGLSLEQLGTWLAQLNETKEVLNYYEVPFVGPFFRISIGQLKKEFKSQILIWQNHLTEELNNHFHRLTSATQELESATLHSIIQCQPKKDPSDWHLLHTLLRNQDEVIKQCQLWKEDLQYWWQLCFEYFISMPDEIMERYWHVMGCMRRLYREYMFSADLLAYAEKEYVTRLEIDDQCVQASVLEYCKELEGLTKVGEPKQIQEMVFRFQSLKGRAERLVQLFDNTINIRTQLHFSEHKVEENYQYFHTTFQIYVQVWNLAQTITNTLQSWRHMVFTELPLDLINTNLEQWQNEVQDWKTQFPTDAPIFKLLLFLETDLNQFSEPWQVAAALANPHLQMRQWFQITKKTGLTAHDLEMLTLEQVYAFHLDLVYDLLIEHSLASSKKNSSLELNKNSGTSKDQQDEKDQQTVFLVLTYNLNSLRMEIHGPENFWSNKKTITIPYSEIERIELHPPEIEKYILREEEMDIMYKKYKELDAQSNSNNPLAANDAISRAASTLASFNQAALVRKGVWHTKTGNQFYLLTLPKEEKEKLEKTNKITKSDSLQQSTTFGALKVQNENSGIDLNLDFDLDLQKDNLIYQIQTLMENAIALVLTESREIPFRKLIFTIPATEASPESCKKKIESCIQLQQLPEVEGKGSTSISE